MKFTGELIVKAPREAVFDRLKDARFFASCVEGVRDLKEVTPTNYTATFETKVAYIKFKFEVAVDLTRADRPDVIEAKIEGKPHGVVGRLSATSAASFVEKDGGTAIQYAVEASLTGRLGSIGQPVLKAKAKEMERLFVQNLRDGLKTGVEEAAPRSSVIESINRLPPPPFWRTPYFEFKVMPRPDRQTIELSDISLAISHAARTLKQPDGRIRFWYYVPLRGKWLRVVTEPDGETVHNVFWDRGFKP